MSNKKDFEPIPKGMVEVPQDKERLAKMLKWGKRKRSHYVKIMKSGDVFPDEVFEIVENKYRRKKKQ